MNTITKIRILNFFRAFNLIRSICYWFDTFNPNITKFYSQFVKSGSLCFDIGANIGKKTDIFLKLGAKVVAVEPNPECVAFLRRKYRFNKNVTIIDKGLDAQETKKDMHICEANSLSSMSQEWIELSKASSRCEGFNWDKTVTVETTTLDQLISIYGKPDYCKIDVEGYELNVLDGLSQQIPVVSLEIAPESIETIKQCIERLSGLGPVGFNHSLGERHVRFSTDQWVSAQAMKEKLDSLMPSERYGELYVRSG